MEWRVEGGGRRVWEGREEALREGARGREGNETNERWALD
jgi:hypothetical protein